MHLVLGHRTSSVLGSCPIDATYCLTDATDWNHIKPCATPLWSGPCGHLADPIPNTGYEPKFCIDVRKRAHADQHSVQTHEFPARVRRDNRRFRGSFYFDIPERQAAASTRQQTTLTRFIGDWPHESRRSMILLQVGQASRRLVRTWIAKQSFQVFSGLCQRRKKRDRDQNVVQTWRYRQNTHKILERKAGLGRTRRKNWLSKDHTKLRQTWRSNIGKREIRILLFLRSIRSSSLNDFSYNRQVDGDIRLKEIK